MTTNTSVVGPAAVIKPEKASRYLLAAVAGIVTSVVASVIALIALGVPQSATVVIGLIVGTLLTGYLIEANTAKRWAVAFGMVFLGQYVLGLIAINAIAAAA